MQAAPWVPPPGHLTLACARGSPSLGLLHFGWSRTGLLKLDTERGPLPSIPRERADREPTRPQDLLSEMTSVILNPAAQSPKLLAGVPGLCSRLLPRQQWWWPFLSIPTWPLGLNRPHRRPRVVTSASCCPSRTLEKTGG